MSVRQNCHWVKCKRVESQHAGIHYEPWDHPSLLSALRELSDYQLWVEERLIPIASKWIEENRDRVVQGMSEEEMNDMGAAIEKAYRLLEAEGYIQESTLDLTPEEHEQRHPAAQRNPLWQSETLRRIDRP